MGRVEKERPTDEGGGLDGSVRRVGWIAEEEGTPEKRWSNLVGEDCFHSVLKLKRSEDQRPRFESRLSAEDNQTASDLFFFYSHPFCNPRYHLPLYPTTTTTTPHPSEIPCSFILKRENRERREGKFEIRTSGDAINSLPLFFFVVSRSPSSRSFSPFCFFLFIRCVLICREERNMASGP